MKLLHNPSEGRFVRCSNDPLFNNLALMSKQFLDMGVDFESINDHATATKRLTALIRQ